MKKTFNLFILLAYNILFQLVFTLLFSPVNPVFGAIAGVIVGSIILILVYKYKYRYKITDHLKLRFKDLIVGIIVGVFAFIVAISIGVMIMNTEKGSTTSMLTNQSGVLAILATTFGVLIAPIIEEIIYRGLFRDIIKNDKVFIVVSSIIFGLMHYQLNGNYLLNLQLVFSTGALGAIFAYSYVKYENLAVPIVGHITYNFIIFILSTIY